MKIRPIDPREAQWEVDDPKYWVIFWSERKAHEGTSFWISSEFELSGTGIQVDEVLAWARAEGKNSAAVVVYVVVDHCDSRGLVKIAGVEPDLVSDETIATKIG